MKLKLVKNEPKYYEFIRKLRLDSENILGFINQNYITENEQIEYMKNNHFYFNICLFEDTPVGFIGVIDNDIRIAVNPKYKNRGIGKFMVNEIMKTNPNALAKIKSNNLASIKLFESCGFKIDYLIMKK